MTSDRQTIIEERVRLEKDIALRHRLQTVDSADELLLRIEDAIGSIQLDLDDEAAKPEIDPPSPRRAEWRARAQRALSRMQFAFGQVQKRRALLERRAERK